MNSNGHAGRKQENTCNKQESVQSVQAYEKLMKTTFSSEEIEHFYARFDPMPLAELMCCFNP